MGKIDELNSKRGEKAAKERDRTIVNDKITRLEVARKKLEELNGDVYLRKNDIKNKENALAHWKGMKCLSHNSDALSMSESLDGYINMVGAKIEELSKEITRLKNESSSLSDSIARLGNAISGLENEIAQLSK